MSAKPSADRRARVGTTRAIEDDLGPRLRQLREERNISLRELARRLGLSASFVSQFETGKSRLSVRTLYAIVTELGVSLDSLFDGDNGARQSDSLPTAAASGAAKELADDHRHVKRASRRQAIELESGVRWESLTPESERDVDFLYVTYDVGGSSCQGDTFIRHSGHEYGLVLSGTLEVTVGFDVYELSPGDSISFDSTVPHRLRNVGTEPVQGVWFVVGRQNDPRSQGGSQEVFAGGGQQW